MPSQWNAAIAKSYWRNRFSVLLFPPLNAREKIEGNILAHMQRLEVKMASCIESISMFTRFLTVHLYLLNLSIYIYGKHFFKPINFIYI